MLFIISSAKYKRSNSKRLVCVSNACKCSHILDQQECRRTELGYDYRGDVSTSASGRECNAWDNLGHRSCRNFPETPDRERPWCFTNITFDVWEYCDIPFCKRESSNTKQLCEKINPPRNSFTESGIIQLNCLFLRNRLQPLKPNMAKLRPLL